MSDPLLRFAPFQHSTHVYAVAELIGHIGGLLEDDPLLQDVWLRGEIVNVSRSPAGHHYFSLKDDLSQLRCVLFRGSAFNSPVMPTNGLAIVAHGTVRVYERNGACELVTDLLFPEGVGLAQIQGERLYKRLESEGLFNTNRKRPLPRLPRRIGVVSSERGAVIHDFLNVLRRRYPLAEVVFAPAPVQGPGAAMAMAHALTRLGQWRRGTDALDAVVLARGGGSDEDLAAFSDERLVRAVFGSPVPVVSAVGHETNVTLSDLVADVRAPTPSAAAELLSPDARALRTDASQLHHRAIAALHDRLKDARRTVAAAHARSDAAALRGIAHDRAQLNALTSRLRALSPDETLSRGYAIISSDGHAVSDASTVQPGDKLAIRLHRGRLISTVDAIELES
jgi:exodeoxyribonuclease VII large subunit